jgi:hypothetical protein
MRRLSARYPYMLPWRNSGRTADPQNTQTTQKRSVHRSYGLVRLTQIQEMAGHRAPLFICGIFRLVPFAAFSPTTTAGRLTSKPELDAGTRHPPSTPNAEPYSAPGTRHRHPALHPSFYALTTAVSTPASVGVTGMGRSTVPRLCNQRATWAQKPAQTEPAAQPARTSLG